MYEMGIFLNINHYHIHTSPTLSQEYPHIVFLKMFVTVADSSKWMVIFAIHVSKVKTLSTLSYH